MALLVLGAASAAFAQHMLTRPVAVRVASVSAGAVREEIIGPGTVQARYSVSLGSRVAGTLDRVLVDVGDEVQKDQLLATLDRTELEARLRASRGAVASAGQDVTLARANLIRARSDLDLARAKDERARNLVEPGLISVEQADETRGAFSAAQANERAALAAVDAKQAALVRLVQEQRVAETVLSYTEIKSPMDGVITRRALEPGSAVSPGAVVFQIVDADALWVAALIDQSLTGRVLLGQHAIIHLRSGTKVDGHVARIALEADPVTRELEVDVAFDKRLARFAINEQADVTIFGEEARGLTVPLEGLNHGRGGRTVYVIEEGRSQRREVRLGTIGAKHAVVTGGLSAGESVILSPGGVRAGQRVAIASGGR